MGTPVLVPVPRNVIFKDGMFTRRNYEIHGEPQRLLFAYCMSGGDYLIIDAANLRAQVLGRDPQLWDDIDECADATFELKEFVQYYHFSLFEDTIAALEVTALIAYDVFRLVQDTFDLIQRGLCVLHAV